MQSGPWSALHSPRARGCPRRRRSRCDPYRVAPSACAASVERGGLVFGSCARSGTETVVSSARKSRSRRAAAPFSGFPTLSRLCSCRTPRAPREPGQDPRRRRDMHRSSSPRSTRPQIALTGARFSALGSSHRPMGGVLAVPHEFRRAPLSQYRASMATPGSARIGLISSIATIGSVPSPSSRDLLPECSSGAVALCSQTSQALTARVLPQRTLS